MASNVLPFPIQPHNDNDHDLPPDPNSSMIFALIYQRLGGSFSIGSNGFRYFGRPEPALFRLQGRPLPQLAGAKPWEEFHDAKEWKGAVKLVEFLLSRVCDDDADYIYDLFASAAVDERPFATSIEEPLRKAA